MPKSKKSKKKEGKSSENILKKRNIIVSPLYSLKKVEMEDNTSYNPFSSEEKSPEKSKKISENDNNENINNNEIKSSPIEEKQNPDIIDINTPSPSNKSEFGNEEDEWNSSYERKKENVKKLKKDLSAENNNNKIVREGSPSSKNKEMHIEECER